MITMTEINKEEWRIKRLTKKITLTEISLAINRTHSLISMWESDKPKGYMSEENVQAYMEYIETHDNRVKN